MPQRRTAASASPPDVGNLPLALDDPRGLPLQQRLRERGADPAPPGRPSRDLHVFRCRAASASSAFPKSAPARKAALLRPFGGTDFSGRFVSSFDWHSEEGFAGGERGRNQLRSFPL